MYFINNIRRAVLSNIKAYKEATQKKRDFMLVLIYYLFSSLYNVIFLINKYVYYKNKILCYY